MSVATTLSFLRVWRAWCEIEGDPHLPVPAFAKPQSLRLDEGFIWMELPNCPEVSALLRGRRFEQGPAFVGNFECALSSQAGTLKTSSGSGGYSIDATDLKTASFMAYYLPNRQSKEAVSVTILPCRGDANVPQITSNNQICISPGGRIEASSNLIGKTVKVQVTYPQTVMLSEEKAESLYLHLVGLGEGEQVYYAGVAGCAFEVVGKLFKVAIGTVNRWQQMPDTRSPL